MNFNAKLFEFPQTFFKSLRAAYKSGKRLGYNQRLVFRILMINLIELIHFTLLFPFTIQLFPHGHEYFGQLPCRNRL